MKRFLLLASLAAVAVAGVAAVPSAHAAKVTCKLSGKNKVKCPKGKLKGPKGPAGPAGPAGPEGPAGPAGPAGSGSPLKFSSIGSSVTTPLVTLDGAVMAADCAGDTFNGNTGIEATAVDAAISVTLRELGDPVNPDTANFYDNDFDSGNAVPIEDAGAADDDVEGTLEYMSRSQAQVATAQYAAADGFAAPRGSDCAIFGTYTIA